MAPWIGIAALALAAVPSQAAMVAHWKFDQTSGTTALDSSGNSYTASNTGGGLTWVAGKLGNAARFDGASSSGHDFSIASMAALNGATKLTVSMWIKPEAAQVGFGYKGLLMTRAVTDNLGTSRNWGLAWEGGNHIDSRISSGPVDSGNNLATVDVWYHVAQVWDGAAGTHKVYVNGVLDPAAGGSSTATSITANGTWYIGVDPFNADRHFKGAIDDLAIWNEAKTATDIGRIYGGAQNGMDAPTALRAYYVSPTGSDSNPGSFSQPFKTIQKAANVVEPGQTVYIRGGTYRETVTVPTSGTAGSPIRFVRFGTEQVVISGCDLVTGWTVHSGSIWKAANTWDVGTNGVGNTLFVDGELKFEASEGAEGDPLRFANWGKIPSGQMTSTYFTATDLKGWGDGFWNGAKVRCHVNDWTIAERTITAYESATGKVTFDSSVGTISQKHTLGYTIFGTLKALNETGEWFKDRTAGQLYYQAAAGQNPNSLSMEFRRRTFGFDVRGRDYIQITGIIFRGVSIQNDTDTDYNTYDRNTMIGYDRANEGRFYISGTGNIFRDNEVKQTWGAFVTVSGTGHKLVNNYLHDIGYTGTARVINMSGSAHLFSHNTVQKVARSFLDGFPLRSEFAYNLFEDGANLSWDTGFFDGDAGRGNGGACIVHHNVFRNSPGVGIFAAFYAGLELVVHHNIIHDISPFSLRAGVWSFLKYYHNTIVGPAPVGDVDAAASAVESNYNNNLQVTTNSVSSIGVDNRGNHNYVTTDFVNFTGKDFRLAAGSGAIDKGIVLPGINDGFAGAAPDAGALEYGQAMWKVGHDFAAPPNPSYAWQAFPGTNVFEDGEFRTTPVGWTDVGTPVWYEGNAWNTSNGGLSKNGRSFQFQPGDGMYRVFTGLKPNTWYAVGSETRLVDQRIECEVYSASSSTVTNGNHRGENYVQGLADGGWLRYDSIDFGTAGKYNQMELTFTRPPGTTLPPQTASLEVRTGSQTGTLLGTFQYNPAIVDNWFAVQLDIAATAGSQSVFLVARGPGAAIIRLASVRLLQSNPAPDQQLTLGVRNHGGSPISTRVGFPYWQFQMETFRFKTSGSATSAEVFIQNNGLYDAYMDRLALYESDRGDVNEAPAGTASQSSTSGSNTANLALDGYASTATLTNNVANSWWQVDLGRPKDVSGIKLTAPAATPGQMSRIQVTAWATTPATGGHPLWQRDFLGSASPGANETLVIKATDLSADGLTELQENPARYVRVQLLGNNLLGNGNLGLATVEVITNDETDLADSDASVTSSASVWEANFPQIVNVGEIVLLNTTASTYPELSNFKVSVWDNNPQSGGAIVWQKDYFTTAGNVAQGGTFGIRGDEVGADGSTRLASVLCRAVRIANNGTNRAGNTRLSLADAKIRNSLFATPRNNLAVAGIAAQSSNYYADSALAGSANNSLALPKGDYTHTRSEAGAWWHVDLNNPSALAQLVLFNRLDNADRIGNFRVSVWNGNPTSGGTELWGKDYSYAAGDLPAGKSLTIQGSTLSGSTRLDAVNGARFVRVRLAATGILSLCEVQVWRPDTLVRLNPAGTGFSFDFGTPSSPVASGWTRLSEATHGDVWWSGIVGSRDRGAVSGTTDLTRDYNYGVGPATLNLKVMNGTWSVTVEMGDASAAHDKMMVWAEGQSFSTGTDTASGTFKTVTFSVAVADGELNLQFDDNGGTDPVWVVNRLSMTRTGP